MKKTYIAPSLTVIDMAMESGVICASMKVTGNTKVNQESQVLSTGDSWSDIWEPAEPQTEPQK